jgi:hypothetical protein
MSGRASCLTTLISLLVLLPTSGSLALPTAHAQPDSKDAPETVQQIEAKCNFDLSETDPKKIRKANECIAREIRIRQERLLLARRLEATREAEANLAATLAQPLPNTTESRALSVAPGTGPGSQGVSGPGSTSAQNFVGGSFANTPSTCIPGNPMNNAALIRVHRQVLTPMTAGDDFGYRLGMHYIVYQVTIENGSSDHQFMLQDVSVDFSQLYGSPAGTYIYSASGQDLSLLRGVPEKGQDLDPRNAFLHVLQGIGSVAGAISGLTNFADVMGPSMAIFNGAFLQAYTTIAPDHTSTQLNRLSDSSFVSNTIIDKQHAKTIAMFIPADAILSQAEQGRFRKDPYAFLGFGGLDGRLNQADICVDGTFIQPVNTVAPSLSSIVFDPSSSMAPGTPAILNITGSNLVGGDTTLVASGAVPATAVVTASSDGKTGTAQMQLPADYDPSKTTFSLQSKFNPSLNSGPGLKIQLPPTLTSATLEKTPVPTAGQPAVLDLVGTNLVSGDTNVIISGATPTTALVTVNADGKSGTAKNIQLPSDYLLGTTTATLKSKSVPTLTSGPVKLQVAP